MKPTLLAFALMASAAAHAMPAEIPQNVPLERLIKNIESGIQADPGNAYQLGQLARLHLFAFARGLEDSEEVNPLLYAWGGIRPGVLNKQPVEVVRQHWGHLAAAITVYGQGIAQSSVDPQLHLGLGCAFEMGSVHIAAIALPFAIADEHIAQALRLAWQDQALQQYRKVLELLPGPSPDAGNSDPNFREEAISGIIQLLNGREKMTRTERTELQRAKLELDAWAKIPREVTPVVFSMQPHQTLTDLLAPHVRVAFDLSGLGARCEWPWVKPETWLLVWDPENSGQISSGRQLFGSVTWWVFWKNGYEALAALDDDQDGALRAAELSGLAAWQDKNSNGISESGEVSPISTLGVREIGATWILDEANTPWQPRGLVLHDGTVLPTFDWIAAPAR